MSSTHPAPTTPTSPSAPAASPLDSYEVHVERDVGVPMRDGTVLVADVYRPARGGRPAEGRFPVLVERTPYDRSRAAQGIALAARFFVRRGYAFVAQDVRGRGDSAGHFHHLLNTPDEGVDGYDTLAWIRAQPWCDGRIGTQGGSFTAANQQAMALYHPPSLAAQFLRDCGTNYYRRMFRYHGAFQLGAMLHFCVHQACLGKEAQANPEARGADPHAR